MNEMRVRRNIRNIIKRDATPGSISVIPKWYYDLSTKNFINKKKQMVKDLYNDFWILSKENQIVWIKPNTNSIDAI